MLIFAAEKSVSPLCKQHNVNYAADAFLDEKHNVNYVRSPFRAAFFMAVLHNQMHIFHTPAVFVFGRNDINACSFDA